MNANKETNYERAKVFLDRKIKVHIIKSNGVWYNGLITEISNSKDFFFIQDMVEDKKLIFFSELSKDIQEYKEEKK